MATPFRCVRRPSERRFAITVVLGAAARGAWFRDGITSGTTVFAVVLAIVFGVWYARERTLSIHSIVTTPRESELPVFAFNWPFLVPNDTTRPSRDLLKQAVELADTDEVARWREAVQRWRRDTLLRGLSDVQAREELGGLIHDYGRAARRLRIATRTRWAVGLTGAVAGIAAAAIFPPAGVVAATAVLGGFVPNDAIPRQLEAGAIFYEARRRFA